MATWKTVMFAENFRPWRKCGHQNCVAWISKESWIVFLNYIYYTIIRNSMLIICFQISYTKLETHNLFSIPKSMCQKVEIKRERRLLPIFMLFCGSLYQDPPDTGRKPWFSTKLQVLDLGKPCAWRRNHQKEGNCCESCGCFCVYNTWINGSFLFAKKSKRNCFGNKQAPLSKSVFRYQWPKFFLLRTVPYPRSQPAL